MPVPVPVPTDPARTDPAAVTERLRLYAAAARTAPSKHNAQPWRFRIAGGALQVLADRQLVRRPDVVDEVRALVHHGPGSNSWEQVPDPQLQADTSSRRTTSSPAPGGPVP